MTPPDPRDEIEREPADWRMLPVIAIGVILIFFVIIPVSCYRWTH